MTEIGVILVIAFTFLAPWLVRLARAPARAHYPCPDVLLCELPAFPG